MKDGDELPRSLVSKIDQAISKVLDGDAGKFWEVCQVQVEDACAATTLMSHFALPSMVAMYAGVSMTELYDMIDTAKLMGQDEDDASLEVSSPFVVPGASPTLVSKYLNLLLYGPKCQFPIMYVCPC